MTDESPRSRGQNSFKTILSLGQMQRPVQFSTIKALMSHVSPDIEQFGRMELMKQTNGWKRWQTHPGVLLSSMSFSSVYNSALFIPSCATHPLILRSKRLYCPKCESLVVFFLFSEANKFRNLIVILQLQGRKSSSSPQSILRQLSFVLLHYVAFAYPKASNMQSSGKKDKFAGKDEKGNEF